MSKAFVIPCKSRLLIYLIPLFLISINSASAQTEINVTSATPCFLNYTASYHMLENCDPQSDYMGWIMSGWEWITGGYISMIIVSLIIAIVYLQYREIIYPIWIGIIFLPISFFMFPAVFLSWAVIMAFVGVGVLIWWVMVRQTS